MLFFDIETAPAPDDAHEFLPEITPPGNYKDPDKIASYIQDKQKEALGKAALDPFTGQVVAISYRFFHRGETHRTHAMSIYRHTEKEMLQSFWNMRWWLFGNQHTRLVGFNVLNFDLPFLLTRSMLYNLRTPWVDLRRYSTEHVIDLMQILHQWSPPYRSLKTWARRLGLDDPLPGMDGSQVSYTTHDENGKPQLNLLPEEQLRAYAINGTELAVQLYDRMEGVYL